MYSMVAIVKTTVLEKKKKEYCIVYLKVAR